MVFERYTKRLKGEEIPTGYSFRVITKNGITKWLEINAVAVQWQGNPGTLNFLRDITVQKLAEEALKESEARYRNIIENLLDVYYRSDREGKLIMISPSGVALLGYNSGDDFIGKSISDTFYFDPEERDRMLSILGERGSIKDFEVTLKHKDGTPISVSASSGYYYNEEGEILGVEGLFRDLRERKWAEEIIHKSEEKFSKAFHSSPILTAISTMEEGRFLDVNEIFLKTLLFSREEVIGKTSLELGLFADPVRRQTIRKITEEQGYAKNIETPMVATNGRVIDGLFSAEPIAIDNEKCWLTVMIDVTEQKQAEEALRKSEKYFKEITENSSDLIIITDKNGDIKYCSRSIERIAGYTPEELIGRGGFTFLHPDDIKRAVDDFGKAILAIDSVIPNAFRIVHKDGSERYLEGLGKNLLDDPAVAGYIMNLRDITERKRSEEMLRASEEKYRSLASSVDSMYLVDRDCRYIFMNEGCRQRFGMPLEDIIGKRYDDFHSGENSKEFAKTVGEVFETSKPIQIEHQSERGQGYLIRTFSPIMDQEGKSVSAVTVSSKDITERKQAEEELRRVNSIQSLILDNSVVGISFVRNRIFEWVNPRLPEMLGLAPNQVQGSKTRIIYSSDEVYEDAGRKAYSALSRGEWFDFEITMPRADGTTFIGRILGKAIDPNLPQEGSIWIFEDITERKRAAEELRESEAKYRLLVDNSYDLIWTLNADGVFTYVSPSWQRALGHEPSDVIGKAFKPFVHPDDVAICEDYLHKVIQARERMSGPEYRVKHVDGTWRWHTASGTPVFSSEGSFISFVGISRDITVQKRAEEALRESEERYRMIFNNSPLGIVHFDANGTIMDFNDKFTQIMGAPKEKILGFNILELRDQAMITEVKEALDGRLGYYEGDYLSVTGGKTTPLRAIYQSITAKDGMFLGAVGLLEDITLRKQAEEEKRGLEERLQRAEKMEALGQLAGGVAHDLNNVLGVLSGYSELLLMEIPEGSRSRGHAEKILQSTHKGAAIVDDLLTLARRGVTASDVINLNSVVSGFLKTPVLEKIKDHYPRVTFRTECDKNLLNIKGSPIHLEKTLMNLVSNAAESISGKGDVTVRTESRYLDKAIRGYDEIKEGDYAVLIVSDTGMGIPAENIEKIFEPFYTKKKMGRSGTGLGLVIVWGTVKDHNGYLDIQTEVGEGTTFKLYFPVTREELIAQQQKVPIERYMGKGESVLVVDDIDEQRDIAVSLITQMGYGVHVVSSGEEAVEYLKWNKADILVLDMIMAPGIDGLETYQRVLGVNPKQKAILVSGFSETDRVREAQEIGAGAYVKKPYVMEKIGVAIRDELNR